MSKSVFRNFRKVGKERPKTSTHGRCLMKNVIAPKRKRKKMNSEELKDLKRGLSKVLLELTRCVKGYNQHM